MVPDCLSHSNLIIFYGVWISCIISQKIIHLNPIIWLSVIFSIRFSPLNRLKFINLTVDAILILMFCSKGLLLFEAFVYWAGKRQALAPQCIQWGINDIGHYNNIRTCIDLGNSLNSHLDYTVIAYHTVVVKPSCQDICFGSWIEANCCRYILPKKKVRNWKYLLVNINEIF